MNASRPPVWIPRSQHGKLERLARIRVPGSRKRVLMKSGSLGWVRFDPGLEARMVGYARERALAATRILALIELLTEKGYVGSQTAVSSEGAFYQLIRGSREDPACHTSPCLLLFDGLLPAARVPNQPQENWVLKRHLVWLFGDCVMMPVFINEIDNKLDTEMGRDVFRAAAEAVVRGSSAIEAAAAYLCAMRELWEHWGLGESDLEPILDSGELLLRSSGTSALSPDQLLRLADEVLSILVEHSTVPVSAVVRDYRAQLEREMA